MKGSVITSFVLCCLLVLLTQPAVAGQYTPAQKAAIIGADPGGNDTGEITPFVGQGDLQCPEGYEKGQFLPNPYKDEKPLFRIDQSNVDKYKDRLSPGQIARLKRNKNFYMNVYPTHRNLETCDEFYAATEKSRKTAHLDDKNILQGFQGGVAFPVPKNGTEAIWNVKRPYSADDAYITDCRRVVSPKGKIKKSIRTTNVLTYDERRVKSKIDNPDKLSYKLLAYYSYPADEAGVTYLTFGYLDDNRLEDAWIYLPTLRRVRRAPSLTGGGQLEGESTMDDLGYEFRGPVNDWNWKLLGKKEMYIPVNNYDIWQIGASDKEECLPGDINPKNLRYELRRVWAVEGTRREGLNHPYGKRVGYYDEDTWQPAVGDRYDKRGNLWRILEWYTNYDYCQRMRGVIAQQYLNLESGRYELSGGCRNEDTLIGIYDSGLNEAQFTVQSLRKKGR